jgi:lipoic acid synthetase/lipoate-protein ligase A
MKYIALPATVGQRRLSFYLAMEEYVARSLGEEDAFFLWQVKPTVIFGRNQSMEGEVNVDYCRRHGIEMYRRKSGGGCVYADEQNLMLSFVTSEVNTGLAFNHFINMVVLVLRRLGIEATSTVHNDVLIDGRKVSGTACYQLPGIANIVHGTLLYDTCMDHMLNAITPSREKLQKKGIESVRQRITVLRDYLPQLSIEELKSFIRSTLCEGELTLTADDVARIERTELAYLKEEFIHLLP